MPRAEGGIIRVGVSEAHGMAVEASSSPPAGVEYSFLEPQPSGFRFIRSAIKGYYRRFDAGDCDLIEAVISPVKTRDRWIYWCEDLPSAAAFTLLGAPLPRAVRIAHLKRLFLADNFKKLVFWSNAGRRTLESYAHIDDRHLVEKSTVVYPAVRPTPDELICFSEDTDAVQLLFSGDFFRKGGVNVIDAFERLQRIHPAVRLVVCSDEKIDFNTPNAALRSEYLGKIAANPAVDWRGRIKRDALMRTVLPKTDVYLLPTYNETFGMAILEAMAAGIPVVATNVFAIPEILEDEKSGLLIDVSAWDCASLFQGYVVNEIPGDFREYVTCALFERLRRLVESPALRRTLGTNGVAVARSRFSFAIRNARMLPIYQAAIA